MRSIKNQALIHLFGILVSAFSILENLHADPIGKTTPSLAQQKQAAIQKGINYLLNNQNPDGSWGNATRTKDLNIYAPLPGAHHAFRTGSTSLALAGLLAHSDKSNSPATHTQAIAHAEAWLFEKLPHLRRATPTAMYNIWGHAYGLRALNQLHLYHQNAADAPEKLEQIKTLAAGELEKLTRYEDVNGGWGYYDFDEVTRKPSGYVTSFTTATVLLAAHETQQIMGIGLSPKIITRALRSIRVQQNPDNTYGYAYRHKERPRYAINLPAGSLARSQACNATLFLLQNPNDKPQITQATLNEWLQRLQDRHGWLDIARKEPVPHRSHFLISGYFYHYGLYYARQCIRLIPPDKKQPHLDFLTRTLIDRQETDGSWWDYPLYNYHYAYGTGYALLTLAD